MDDVRRAKLCDLARRLAALRASMLDAEASHAHAVRRIHERHDRSSANLLHYLAMRSAELRPLQEELRRLGLSSLGRCEGCALATVESLLESLAALTGEPALPERLAPVGFDEADRLLADNAATLLGAPPPARQVLIMVTLPSESADAPDLVRALVDSGMDLARINGAHDDPDAWARMAGHVRDAATAAGRPCRILVDLPGPKLRTGEMAKKKSIVLRPGDHLLLTRPEVLGRRSHRLEDGRIVAPASIGCLMPEVLAQVRPGNRVWFDDGKIGAVVRDATPDRLELEIVRARPSGERLRPGKGINLPDTDLSLPAVGPGDEAALRFAAEQADAVGLSFVHEPTDVHVVRTRLRALGGREPGIVLKIETRRAFDRLPELMLAAMSAEAAGVMIARGDLAVEVGYERLAEVQEEILWLCEAAHMPVIWATQVLETLAKRGRATRAEVTDASVATRAECVMLNKGPYIVHAVRTLDDILRRMSAHQFKKRAMLRPLAVARTALDA